MELLLQSKKNNKVRESAAFTLASKLELSIKCMYVCIYVCLPSPSSFICDRNFMHEGSKDSKASKMRLEDIKTLHITSRVTGSFKSKNIYWISINLLDSLTDKMERRGRAEILAN